MRTNEPEVWILRHKQSQNTVTDPEVTKIGSVKVQFPDTGRGKDKKLEVSMYFGGTEITAIASDISSTNSTQTTSDFFFRS